MRGNSHPTDNIFLTHIYNHLNTMSHSTVSIANLRWWRNGLIAPLPSGNFYSICLVLYINISYANDVSKQYKSHQK